MPRPRDPNREKAFLVFKEFNGDITNRSIAEKLGVLEKTISSWKNRDKWVASLGGNVRSTTNTKRSTSKKQSVNKHTGDVRSTRQKQVVDSLVEAGTYSPALDLLVEIYLDAYEEYILDGKKSEKLRKELAKYLGQLGLDGKNKELIKSNGKLLAKGDEEKEKENETVPAESSKLVQFRQRMSR